jgi:hypothetical protein
VQGILRLRNLQDRFSIDMIDQDDREAGFGTGAPEPLWSVWRQDDNGNAFLVMEGMTEGEASRLARDLESRGHKQTYWVRREG